jgi:DNA ligase D-like protein (predicted 3'-phosphoesterase)
MHFVVQQHQASTLHYDFRLEVDGVLRSWAIPKGPSMDPADKRLAVEVEDHSLEWGAFEGRIGAGYGKGAVIVWDRGSYESLDDVPMAKALARGKASFRLDGEKLRGGFTLVRTDAGAKPKWLLVKRRDDEADGERPVRTRPESVVSGRTISDVDP